MNCYFKVDPAHLEYADHTAYARLVGAIRQGRENVGHRSTDDILWSYIRGCRAEMAFYLWLGGKRRGVLWRDLIENPTNRDLSMAEIEFRGRKIDAKLRPEGWVDYIVRKKGVVRSHYYVLCHDSEFPLYVFAGWLLGSEVMNFSIGGRLDIPGYMIPAESVLWDCMEFKLKGSRFQSRDPA